MTPEQEQAAADLMDLQSQDINEVLKRWNAYPKLVEAAKKGFELEAEQTGCRGEYNDFYRLLKELGELWSRTND
jgi:hypothetical protein